MNNTVGSETLWQSAALPQDLFNWLEETLQTEIIGLQKQGRGRPAWFIDTRDARFYLRCDRGIAKGINQHYRLNREVDLLEKLSAHAIPVAKVHGFNVEHQALLQEFVEGDVFFHHIEDEAEREAVGTDFMRALAALHALDPATLALPEKDYYVPKDAYDHAWHDLHLWADVHYKSIEEPEPFMSFTLAWLHRYAPTHVKGTVIVQGDTGPGQFIYKNGKVTAIVDWEYAHWGCPMEDLAEIRQRDLLYPFGDMRKRFEAYAEFSGTELDWDLIFYYTVRSLINTPLALIGPELLYPQRHADTAERLAWNALFMRVTAEALAEAMAIDLSEDQVELPTCPPKDATARLFDVVVDDLQNEQLPQIEDSYQAHRLRSSSYVLEHLRQAYNYGPQLEAQDLDEMAAILGTRPNSITEGNLLLERRVREQNPAHDEALIRYFYRYSRRKELILGDAVFSQGDQGKRATLQLLRTDWSQGLKPKR
jgi:aminoglycoside phosphotransferase (APT) family kinase protein